MMIDELKYEALLNTEEIRRRIEKFESLDLSFTSSEQILSAILDIFSVEDEGKKTFIFEYVLTTMSNHERFYRVRKLDSFPQNRAPCEADFWNHPEAPINRFNRAGEKVLYASKDVETPLQELRVGKSEPFILIEYINTLPLILCPSEISNRYSDKKPISEALGMLNNFITSLARINVGENERYKYKATRALADLLYMLTDSLEETLDGIFYVSVHTGEMKNIAIKGKKLNKLMINNMWVASRNELNTINLYKQIFIESGTIRCEKVSLSSIEHFARNISLIPY
ncbi:MAG TPA: hypothetical protein DCY10_01220 [Clostridiales bacterium]|nr:hypothetical protein [Clostridiales bacterium]